MLRARFACAVCALLVSTACGTKEGGFVFDADRPDGSMVPPYRPPRCADAGPCADGEMPPLPVDMGPPPPPCNEVTFTYADDGASDVLVSGSWLVPEGDPWPATEAEGALALMAVDDGWELTTLIEPIGRHEYKLIVDGEWIADPSNPETSPDGFGGFNSVLDPCGASCGDVAEFDWRDSVMYFAMVDRFRDSDGMSSPVPSATGGDAASGPSGQYEGGDLAGATERLDYLADLGVTSIWLSAPYDNRELAGEATDPAADPHLYSAYHGYWPKPANVDYGGAVPSPRPAVESRIGTESDLRAFVDGAHGTTGANGHGIKVLFDYVMNHVDIESGLYTAHPDWFARDGGRIRNCARENLWDDPYWGTRCAFTDYLPPFDFENPAPRAWSVADAIWWATEYGIDGYRLDAIKHVPQVWLTDLRAAVDAEITDVDDRFYMVGETFNWDQQDVLAAFIDPETKLDGQFDFPLRARLCEAVFQSGGDLGSLSAFMDGNDAFYGPDAIMSTWIGNHDIPRAIHYASREITNCREGSNPGNGWDRRPSQPTGAEAYERLGVAFAVLMTNGGVPLIYYGDEIGLAGGGDPDNRRMMAWDDGDLNAHQRTLRSRVRALARARGANPVLGRGRRVTLEVSRDTWVYQRVGCDDVVTVAINKSDELRTVTLPPGDHQDLLDGSTVVGGTVSMPARSFLVVR